VLRWEDLLALLRQVYDLQEWANLVAVTIVAAKDYPNNVGQWLTLQSLAVHYRDHLCKRRF